MQLQVGKRAATMESHEPHHILLDFSSSPAKSLAFDHHGLLSPLHDDRPLRAAGSGGDTTPWPPPQPQVFLSLYDTAPTVAPSLVSGGQRQQPPFSDTFPAAPSTTMMSMQQPAFRLNSSRYLGPVKELLREFCSLEGDAMNGGARTRAPKWNDVESSSPACSPWVANPSLGSMDYLALERRKARLLSMVEEVDMRYRRYREQMRATEISFEAMVGTRTTHVYTKLAICAMSRHFRSLRDALMGQIRALKKSMGESGSTGDMSAIAIGASRGDTPRLRMLDQRLRHQKTFQQSGKDIGESYPWRPQRGLPERAVAILRSWLFEHFLHAYPNDVDKHILARQSGLSGSQVSNWFINARIRLWKPMIEEMYAEETKQHDAGGGKPAMDHHSSNAAAWTTATSVDHQSRRPHLGGRNDPSSCFAPSSIAADDGYSGGRLFQHSYPSLHGGGGGSAVSLTLGLQQQQQQACQSPAMMMQQQSSLLLGLAGKEEDVLVQPYRNLMGSELMHDLADRVYN